MTLGEGGTPLLPAPRLSERLGCDLWLKWEGANPTGSFKDRGMAVAVSRALARGAPGVVCASTGNTASSAAAYAARAGLPAVIFLPAGAVARGKLAQVLVTGAELREVEGSFSDVHLLARQFADEEGWVNVNSINPDRIEGQSSAAREIVEQLGGVPDVLALVALRLAAQGVSIARLVQQQGEGSATLHIVTHEAPAGRLRDALDEINALEEARGEASALPVISDRGVVGLGWA